MSERQHYNVHTVQGVAELVPLTQKSGHLTRIPSQTSVRWVEFSAAEFSLMNAYKHYDKVHHCTLQCSVGHLIEHLIPVLGDAAGGKMMEI